MFEGHLSIAQLDRRKWIGIATICLFVWLRWFSGLWQYHWTGFCFGIVLVLTIYLTPGAAREYLDLAGRYDIKSVYLVTFVVFLYMGVRTVRRFFQGGTSDDGLTSLVSLAFAIGGGYIYYRLLRKSPKLPAEDQQD